ncbi:MAG TPA: CDP-alcohol phosphatidyltransferase family protein [Steroidobacteraceae bacterium]
MNLSFLPNLLCILRLLLVYPVAHGILLGHYPMVLALFALAAFTDGLDGFLAKTFRWTSELGRYLDPLADKVLLVTVFVCLSWVGHAPWWLTLTVLARDLVIGGGALAYRVLIGRMHGRPTMRSKLNTLCQVALAFALVSSVAYGVPASSGITALGALAFVSTVVSGIEYVLIYSRRARQAVRARRGAAAS